MEEVINELLKFSPTIIELGKAIEDQRIQLFEKQYSLILPSDFKEIISRFNGINLMGNEVYGFNSEIPNSIENIYYYEHFEVVVPQFKYLVPFSPDGGGNFYCLDTSTTSRDSCAVVFWVSNYKYSDIDRPEIVNESFIHWLKQVIIDWTLEDYNYDGSRKFNQ